MPVGLGTPGPTGRSLRSGHERDDPGRHLLVGRRDADEGLVPARRPLGRGADPPLRRALRHGRGELDVLPAARRRARRQLGRADAGRLHDAREGVRADDPPSRQARVAARGPARRDAGRRRAAGSTGRRASSAPRSSAASRARVEPLRERGKLGGILLQFPPYIVYKPASLEYIEWAAAQLPGDEILVEFRHRSWLDEENRAQTLAFLESRGLTYVIVDAPKTEAKNLVPTVVARTSKTAYVRFHGRNAAHLEQAHRQRRGALRLPLLGAGAGGVGRAAARARRRGRVGLRDVQQQRPLGDAVDRPRGARAGGGRRRSRRRARSRRRPRTR